MSKLKNRGKRVSTTSGQERAKLTPQESAKRMQAFAKRKENFVAAVRKGKDRSLSA